MAYTRSRLRRKPFDPSDPLADEDEFQPEEEQDEDLEDEFDQFDEYPDEDRDEPFNPWAESQPPLSQTARPQSAQELFKTHLNQPPERKPPTKLRRALAGLSAGAMVFGGASPERAIQSVQHIKYPGYEEAMEQWKEKGKALATAADLETKQTEEQRRIAQHEAALGTERAQTEAARARGTYYQQRMGMPPAPKIPTTYEAYLTQKLSEAKTPEEQAAFEGKLQNLKTKDPAEKNLIVREFYTRDGAMLRFYDPLTGEQVREEQVPGAIRPPTVESPGAAETRVAKKEARQKEKKANELAGQALQAAGDDKAKARQWLMQNVSDHELRTLALKKIGEPKTVKDRAADLKEAFGLKPGPSSPFPGAKGSTGSTGNPYRR